MSRLHMVRECRVFAPADPGRRSGGHRGRVPFGRPVLGAATAVALAILSALSVGDAPAEAAFPGANGRIACEGRRGLVSQDAIPSWSPDGTKIAFQSLRASDATHPVNLEVFTMDPDGSGVTNVTNSPGTAGTAAANGNALDRDVIWSPDSAQLAFSSTRDNTTSGNQNFEVYKMKRDGANPTRLTSNLSGDTPNTSGDYDAPNSWSPDGKRILFTTGRTSTPDADEFIANTMDANAGEAAGLQRVALTNIFVRCDWQRVAASAPAPGPPGGGGGGGGGGSLPPKPRGCVTSASVKVIGKPESTVLGWGSVRAVK